MATLDDLQAAITALADDDFRVLNSKGKPATAAEITALEAQLGAKLSPQQREFLASWGVLVVEVVETLWPRPKEFDVAPAWKFEHTIHVFGAGAAVPPALAVATQPHPPGSVPVLRRTGARWLVIETNGVLAAWEPEAELSADDERVGNFYDVILAELKDLEHGIVKLRQEAESADTLVARGRALRWKTAEAGTLIDALKKRPGAELAPHVPELVALLDSRFTIGVLDLLAAAGPAAVAPVANRIYAHFGKSASEYVIELLGKLGDVSPGALAVYCAGLRHEDSDIVGRTLDVLAEHASLPAIASLRPDLEARLAQDFEEDDHHFLALALVSRFGGAVDDQIAEAITSSTSLSDVLRALHDAGASVTSHADAIRARARTVEPTNRSMLEVAEALVDLGLGEPWLADIVRTHWLPKGGRWTTRATALLDKLQP